MARHRLGVAAAFAVFSCAATSAGSAPPFALNDAALQKAICGAHACELEFVGRVPTAAGQPEVSVVRWPLCRMDADGQPVGITDDEMRTDGGCAIGYFRVQHQGAKVQDVRFVAADGNAGPLGYGAGGGDESVELDAKAGVLVHAVDGDSGWRWQHEHRWKLAPVLALDAYEAGSFWRLNPEWARSEKWTAATAVMAGGASYNACRFDARKKLYQAAAYDDNNPPDASTASFADPPLIGGTGFDWQRTPLPNWLEVRADAAPGPRRHTDVITATTAPASPLVMRMAWVDGSSLLLELEGTEADPAARIELWWWTDVNDGSVDCILSADALTRGAGKGARIHNDDSRGRVLVAEGVKQLLITPDGRATPAFGKPDAGELQILAAAVDGRRRLLVRWGPDAKDAKDAKAPEPVRLPFAVALSTQVGKRQHLVSHTPLRFADPTSFAIPIQRDMRALDIDTADWNRMVLRRFAAPARKK